MRVKQEPEPLVTKKTKSLDLRDKGLTSLATIIPKENKILVLTLVNNSINELPQSLNALRELNLGYNHISEISPQMCDALLTYKNLEKLDISSNDLFDFPDVVPSMKNLKELNLFGNHISELLIRSNSLKVLNVGHNFMRSIPEIPGSLRSLTFDFNLLPTLELVAPKLKELSLVLVGLQTISPNIKFPKLETLDLSRNKLAQLPDLKKLAPKLKKINLSDNLLSSFPLPPKSIEEYNIHGNSVSSLPALVVVFHHLLHLDISHNKVKQIPALPECLEVLYFHQNEVDTTTNCNAPNLKQMTIRHNKLAALPAYDNNQVRDINISKNLLTTVNMAKISPNTINVDFSHNLLVSIPGELFYLQHLQKLNLANNQITEIPKTISHSKTLSVINLTRNPIKVLPVLPLTLTELYIGYCQIEDLTRPLGKARNLLNLVAPGNKISTVPDLPTIKYLNLSRNKITSFPTGLGKRVTLIDLSYNAIKKIPPNLDFALLEELDLTANKITIFPDSFTLPKLKSLRISQNKINMMMDPETFKDLDILDITLTGITFAKEPEIGQLFVSRKLPQYEMQSTKELTLRPWLSLSDTTGLRKSMEDSVIVNTRINRDVDIYCVFDGHGGIKTGVFGAFYIANALTTSRATFHPRFFEIVFRKLAAELDRRSYPDGSTMALVAFNGKKVISVHLGDARILIIDKEGKIVHATEDHKPYVRKEFERIHMQGGRVTNDRVHGLLAPGRSFGDFHVPGNSCEPEIIDYVVQPDDKWIIIGCDGIFDVLSNHLVAEIAKTAQSAEKLAADLKNMAFSMQSDDNITCIVCDILNRDKFENEECLSTDPPVIEEDPDQRLSITMLEADESLFNRSKNGEGNNDNNNNNNNNNSSTGRIPIRRVLSQHSFLAKPKPVDGTPLFMNHESNGRLRPPAPRQHKKKLK